VDRDTLIGREDADITIGDPQISRRHAIARPSGDGIEIEDAGSSNGTFVNGIQISSSTSLSNGDSVRVGQTELEVEIEQPKSAGTVIAGAPQGTVVAPKSPAEAPPAAQEPPAAAEPTAPAAAQPPPTAQPPAYTPPGGGPSYTPPPGQGPAPYGSPGGQPPGGPGYPPPTGPQYASPVRPKGMAPQGSGSKGWLIALVVGLVVVIAAVAAFFLFFQSSDEDEIRDTIETVATNPADPDTCDLFTQRFKEEGSGQTGTAADDACRTELEEAGESAEDVEIESVEVDGDNATAEVTGEEGNTVTVLLVNEDGVWKIDAFEE
jgi:flagellar basal body-associated protein FliL